MSLEKRVSENSDKVTVTFRVPAQLGATRADLVGEFTDWKLVAMHPGVDGNLESRLELEAGHAYCFRYLIDGERWENDWEADRYMPNEYGGDDSVVDLRRPVDLVRAERDESDDLHRSPAAVSPRPEIVIPSPEPPTRKRRALHKGKT